MVRLFGRLFFKESGNGFSPNIQSLEGMEHM
jgi:hypothetical protein